MDYNENQCGQTIGSVTAPYPDMHKVCEDGPLISTIGGEEDVVRLSPRLKMLIRQVGGCQTSQVEAVIKRVLFEVLSANKLR